MASASGIKAGRAYVELGVDDKLTKGLATAQKRLASFGKAVRNIGLAVSAAGAAVTAPIAALAKRSADSGAEMVAMSQRTGISVEKLSELGFAAKLTGTDMQTLEGSIARMQRTIAGVADAAEGTTGSLDQLGLSAADLIQLSPDRQFALIAQRIAAIPNPAQRAAAAMQVFGRSGTALLPMIQNLGELTGMAAEMGLVASTAGAKEAQRFADTLTILGMAAKAVGGAIGSAVIPILSEYAKVSIRAALAVRDWIKQHKELIVTAFKVGSVVVGIGSVIAFAGLAISKFGLVFGAIPAAVSLAIKGFTALSAVLMGLASPLGLVTIAVGALGAYLVKSSGAGAAALAYLADAFRGLQDEAVAAFGGIKDALAAGDLALAARILWLTLRLEWTKGVAALQQSWATFKGYFLQVASDAFYGALIVLNDAWASLQVAWVETTNFLANTWTAFTTGIQKAWNVTQNWLTKGWLHLMGLFDKGFDVNAAVKLADQQAAAANQQLDQQAQKAIGGSNQQRDDRRQEIEQQRQATERVIVEQGAGADAKRSQQSKADIDAARKALGDARKEWQDALAEAAKKRPPESKPLDRFGGPGNLDAMMATIGKVTTFGTFNAAALRGLGGGQRVQERAAKAAEETARNTKRIERAITDSNLAFA